MPIYKDVIKMHEKFKISGIKLGEHPQTLSEEEREFRVVCLNEEVQEFEDAVTIEEEIDAMIDLTVFALGTLERMGVHFQPHWDEVMKTNMAKELCQSADESKRDFAIDLKKPADWVEPCHNKILQKYYK